MASIIHINIIYVTGIFNKINFFVSKTLFSLQFPSPRSILLDLEPAPEELKDRGYGCDHTELKGTKSINMEGTRPLRGQPYPTL